MDNLINILRKSTTPSEGVNSADEYNNGAGFLNPLAWVVEDGEDMDGFPSGLYAPKTYKRPHMGQDLWTDPSDGTTYLQKDGEPYIVEQRPDQYGLSIVEGPIDTSELRKKIKDASNGTITVNDSITNVQALKNLENIVSLIRDYNNGAFLPKNVVIYNKPDDLFALGRFFPRSRKIQLTNTDAESSLVERADRSAAKGSHPNNNGMDTTPLHELGHAAQNATDHMYEQQGPNALLDRLRLMQNELSAKDASNFFRKQAAAANGYDSPQEADATISKYATETAAEAFAEAFADVLINGENAAPYAQSLIQLYLQEANRKRARIDDYMAQNPFDRETAYARMENILNGRSTLNP